MISVYYLLIKAAKIVSSEWCSWFHWFCLPDLVLADTWELKWLNWELILILVICIKSAPSGSCTLQTKVYFKPTDTHQLLHRTSFQLPHTFKGIVVVTPASLPEHWVEEVTVADPEETTRKAAAAAAAEAPESCTCSVPQQGSSHWSRRMPLVVWPHPPTGDDQWKATEFRQFLLHTRAAVLLRIVPEILYKHFLLMCVGILLLTNPKLCSVHYDYANDLFRTFVTMQQLCTVVT